MDTQLELRTLLKIRSKSIKDFANAIKLTEATTRLRLKKPMLLTIEECNASDNFLELPSGTTHAVVNGIVMYEDMIEYING